MPSAPLLPLADIPAYAEFLRGQNWESSEPDTSPDACWKHQYLAPLVGLRLEAAIEATVSDLENQWKADPGAWDLSDAEGFELFKVRLQEFETRWFARMELRETIQTLKKERDGHLREAKVLQDRIRRLSDILEYLR